MDCSCFSVCAVWFYIGGIAGFFLAALLVVAKGIGNDDNGEKDR